MDRVTTPSLHQLLKVVDAVEVIGQHITLKKAGRNYVGCCPFHHEKTPSFSVSREKGLYYCFGCKAKGNVLSFVMQHTQVSLLAAAEALAATYGVTLAYSQRHLSQNAPLLAVLSKVMDLYREQLSLEARNFCQKRGLTEAVIAQYQLGYAQELTQHEFSQAQLVTAGLLRQTEHGQCFEIFKHRLMFPIKTSRGVCIGFGGRVLSETLPKYLNSPESVVFHKRTVLYGVYELLARHPHPAVILLVEGYLDVLSLASKGYHTAVAVLGSAVSSTQAQKLFELTKKVIVCFDGDAAGVAGQQAAWTQFGQLLQQQHELFFCTLPAGYDPDTYVQQHGLSAFQQLLAAATHHLDYFMTIISGPDIFQTLTKAQTIMQALQNPPYQLALAHKLASVSGLQARNVLAALLPPKTCLLAAPATSSSTPAIPFPFSLRTQALAYVLQYPQTAALILQEGVKQPLGLAADDPLTHVITLLQQYPAIENSASLLAYIQQYHASSNAICQHFMYHPLHLTEDELGQEFRDTLRCLARSPASQIYPKLQQLLPPTYFEDLHLNSPGPAQEIMQILKYKHLTLRHQALPAEEPS